MFRRHHIGVQHDDGGTGCKACTRIAGAGITAIAVHDRKLEGHIMKDVQATQHMLGIVLNFRRIEHEDEFGVFHQPGIGCH